MVVRFRVRLKLGSCLVAVMVRTRPGARGLQAAMYICWALGVSSRSKANVLLQDCNLESIDRTNRDRRVHCSLPVLSCPVLSCPVLSCPSLAHQRRTSDTLCDASCRPLKTPGCLKKRMSWNYIMILAEQAFPEHPITFSKPLLQPGVCLHRDCCRFSANW